MPEQDEFDKQAREIVRRGVSDWSAIKIGALDGLYPEIAALVGDLAAARKECERTEDYFALKAENAALRASSARAQQPEQVAELIEEAARIVRAETRHKSPVRERILHGLYQLRHRLTSEVPHD